MEKLKFCIDCKYYEFNITHQFPVCLHEKSGHYDIVSGNKHPFYCRYMREKSNLCGKEGGFFEKKEE